MQKNEVNLNICEHDIDSYLVEDINVNSAFRKWLCDHRSLAQFQIDSETLKATRNPDTNPDNLQVDVGIIGKTKTNEEVSILIEDKIKDKFQMDQPENYAQHRDNLRNRGIKAFTMLYAPKEWLKNHPNNNFDFEISHEESQEFWKRYSLENSESKSLADFRINVLNSTKHGSFPQINIKATEFIKQYLVFVRNNFKHLEPQDPTGGEVHGQEYYATYRPEGIKECYFYHYMKSKNTKVAIIKGENSKDYVALSISKPGQKERLVENFEKLLRGNETGIKIDRKPGARDTARIIIELPPEMRIDITKGSEGFEDERQKVNYAACEIHRLYKWYKDHRREILSGIQ